MRKPIIYLGASALVLMAAAAQAGELTLDKVPDPVRDAAQARFADAKLVEAAKDKSEDGKDIYEIGMENKDQNRIDMTLTPEGSITLIEMQITRKELPEAVAQTLEKKYPKARYRLVERILEVVDKEEKLKQYEVVLVTPKKQIWGVEVAVDGKLLTEEKRTSETED